MEENLVQEAELTIVKQYLQKTTNRNKKKNTLVITKKKWKIFIRYTTADHLYQPAITKVLQVT